MTSKGHGGRKYHLFHFFVRLQTTYWKFAQNLHLFDSEHFELHIYLLACTWYNFYQSTPTKLAGRIISFILGRTPSSVSNEGINHFTDLLRTFQLPESSKLPDRGQDTTFPKYSATQLHEAGVKFTEDSNKKPAA
ncbi:hypothetical protein CFP56_040596 [Quercus suber]|uniref:Uncharacterized protein n=1 Tax=Quercus suber TaxID=58331 RepID=A0AAW0LJX1_QUESU